MISAASAIAIAAVTSVADGRMGSDVPHWRRVDEVHSTLAPVYSFTNSRIAVSYRRRVFLFAREPSISSSPKVGSAFFLLRLWSGSPPVLGCLGIDNLF